LFVFLAKYLTKNFFCGTLAVMKDQGKKMGTETESRDRDAQFAKNSNRASTKKTALWVGSVVILIFSAITFGFIPAAAGGMSSKTPVYG
jgi:hypothetical protein